MEFISKLNSPPRKSKKDLHYWADYIELLCLINADGMVSQNDFIDRIKQDDRDLEDSDEFNEGRSNIEVNENLSLLAEDCFNLIEYRQGVFHPFYPFFLSADGKNIHLNEEITFSNKIYLFLLFCSTLGYFRSFTPDLTSSFERLCHERFKQILPNQISKSYIFGSSNIEAIENDAERKSTFWKKINDLATNIRESVVITEDRLSKRNRGDGGLDIVGWIELGDGCSHIPLFFCQCACTSDWTTKQNSSKPDRWTNFISLATHPLNFIFIPFAFRSANGEWHEAHLIEKSILFDRLRLISNFKIDEDQFRDYKSFPIIEKIIKSKESTV